MTVLGYFCRSVFNDRAMFKGTNLNQTRKTCAGLVVLLLSLGLPDRLQAQCAMCRAVVEQGGEEVAEGINSGIVYLMAFPYLVVAVSAYLFYRNWKRTAVAR